MVLLDTLIEPIDQSADHFGDGLKAIAKSKGIFVFDGYPKASNFDQGNAFLSRASRDGEEVSAVGFGEAAVALCDVGGD